MVYLIYGAHGSIWDFREVVGALKVAWSHAIASRSIPILLMEWTGDSITLDDQQDRIFVRAFCRWEEYDQRPSANLWQAYNSVSSERRMDASTIRLGEEPLFLTAFSGFGSRLINWLAKRRATVVLEHVGFESWLLNHGFHITFSELLKAENDQGHDSYITTAQRLTNIQTRQNRLRDPMVVRQIGTILRRRGRTPIIVRGGAHAEPLNRLLSKSGISFEVLKKPARMSPADEVLSMRLVSDQVGYRALSDNEVLAWLRQPVTDRLFRALTKASGSTLSADRCMEIVGPITDQLFQADLIDYMKRDKASRYALYLTWLREKCPEEQKSLVLKAHGIG